MNRYKMTVEFSCIENKETVEDLIKENLEGAMEFPIDLNCVNIDSIDIVEN